MRMMLEYVRLAPQMSQDVIPAFADTDNASEFSDIIASNIIVKFNEGQELLEELQVTQPTLSHHMKVLSDCGLVSSRKDGKWQHYSICCERFAEYKEYIGAITCYKDKENSKSSCCCNE